MRRVSSIEFSESELQFLQQTVSDAVASGLKRILPEIIPPPSNNNLETYLTRQEVCELLKISLPTLSAYTHEGIIRAKRFGRSVRYLKKDIEAAMQDVRSIKYKR